MKRVVLVGDSVRFGYQEYVAARLTGLADVLAPAEKGGDSRFILEHLDSWAIDPRPDIIHVNSGLHDIRREFDADENAIPLTRYAHNVRMILSRLKNETDAQIIWATTTPVIEAWHHENNRFDRFEADVAAYNEASVEIATSLGIPINDLYGLLLETDFSQMMLFEGAHFKDEGYSILGRAVANFIGDYL